MDDMLTIVCYVRHPQLAYSVARELESMNIEVELDPEYSDLGSHANVSEIMGGIGGRSVEPSGAGVPRGDKHLETVALNVPSDRAEQAREVVEKYRDDVGDEDVDDWTASGGDDWKDDVQGLRCPKCGSEEIGLDPLALVVWTLLIGLAFFVATNGFGLPVWDTFTFGTPVLLLGVVLIMLRLFKLACKSCQHSASRSEFEPPFESNDDA